MSDYLRGCDLVLLKGNLSEGAGGMIGAVSCVVMLDGCDAVSIDEGFITPILSIPDYDVVSSLTSVQS